MPSFSRWRMKLLARLRGQRGRRRSAKAQRYAFSFDRCVCGRSSGSSELAGQGFRRRVSLGYTVITDYREVMI
eukprot:scaffold1928_cov109-Alexandrium_tamarense.AAC.29